MGVDVPTGRKGGTVDLNLVPFVDFLSCLIAFLMMSAVLVDLQALPTEQAIGEGAGEAPAPMTVHLSREAVWLGRDSAGVKLAHRGDAVDWASLEAQLTADRATFPERRAWVLNVDDDVGYGEAAAVLDLATRLDYAPPVLAGGPASDAAR